MVASVPIPFLSISPIKSDSDIGSGGVVWPGDGDVDVDEGGSGDDIGDIGNIDIGDGDNNDGDNSDGGDDGAEDINGGGDGGNSGGSGDDILLTFITVMRVILEMSGIVMVVMVMIMIMGWYRSQQWW